MIGIIVQLAISWLLVWLFEKGNLKFLGFYPAKKRLLHFALFFIITGLCCAMGFFLKMYITQQQWILNPQLKVPLLLKGMWWNIKSVLFEELIFRGVLLYILLKKLRGTKAIIISAIAFGIYHWFSHELFWDIKAMAIEFAVTGAMGLLLAYAYAKTYSLYIPIAIHIGWGIVQQVIFSNGPIGNQLFIEVMPRPVITISYFSFFIVLLLPILSMLTINFILIKNWYKLNLLKKNNSISIYTANII
jgi:uncharacterized protein